MNSEKFREWLEIFGIFGIIASLLFVGLEMRQSQKIALSAAYQARSDSSMVIRMAVVESEALQSANGKLRQGKAFDDLSPEELSAVIALTSGNMIYLENMHYQYVNGFISEEHWETNRAELRQLLGAIKNGGNGNWRFAVFQRVVLCRNTGCC